MLGRAAVAMWWNAPPEMREEIEDWHTHEHMPERLAIPGFLRGTRWQALDGTPSYFILYEVARVSVLTGPEYMARLNDPTPWSRRMMPHHLDMVRSLCRVQASSGGLVGAVLATVRFSPPRRGGRTVAEWLAKEMLPPLAQRKGIAGACLLQARRPAVAASTTEQQIRGQDGTADSVLILSGYDASVVARAGDEMRASLAARKADVHPAHTLYAPAYSLCAKDLGVH
jgi:hypothetical protein